MYAFGVMAYELLVGRPPFRDPLFVRRLHGRSLPPPPSIAAVRPRIDRGVAALIDGCLAMRPVHRPSAKDAVRVLREAELDADPTSLPSMRAL
jgi:serine/threonine protein kinase